MGNRRVMVGVFAHPDDESFGPGGTLARYASEGADVHVIIATDGSAGSVEDGTDLREQVSLAQMRAHELTNAALALGVASVWSLPYRDSGMRGAPENDHPDALIRQPIDALIAEVLGYLQRMQPQVVVTHDPFGGYGHPDHIRVCEAVTAAFYLAQSPQKLYYTAMPKGFLKVMVRLLPLWGVDPAAIGRNKDINLVEISRWDTPINAKIDVSAYMAVKDAASKAHASQYNGGPSWAQIFPEFIKRRVLGTDTFTRAYPAANGVIETDLFAGVTRG